MTGKAVNRRSRRMALIGAALYAVVLLVAPFEHHDLVCHIKTPQHCTSCSASLVGSDPDTPAVLQPQLSEAGRALACPTLAESALFAVRSPGRSPPAAHEPFL